LPTHTHTHTQHTQIMYTNLFFFLIVSLISVCYSLEWQGVNANGHPVERTFTVLQSPDKGDPYTFSVLATQRKAIGKSKTIDAIEFTFSVIGLPHFVVRFFAHSSDSVEATAHRHALRKLVEYIPNPLNSSAGFQPGTNNLTVIVQEQFFWGSDAASDWSALSVTESTDSSTGANIYTICSTNGIGVNLCVYSADIWSQLTVNGSTFSVDPNSIHHSLDISNFPWLGTNTQLALKVHFEAHTRVVPLNDSSLLNSGEQAFDLSDSGTGKRPVSSWDDTVSVAGSDCSSTADVVRSVIYENDVVGDLDQNIQSAMSQWSDEVDINLITRIVYFSFLTDCNQPTNINWDPEDGIVDSGSFILFPTLSIVLLAILSSFYF